MGQVDGHLGRAKRWRRFLRSTWAIPALGLSQRQHLGTDSRVRARDGCSCAAAAESGAVPRQVLLRERHRARGYRARIKYEALVHLNETRGATSGFNLVQPFHLFADEGLSSSRGSKEKSRSSVGDATFPIVS
jgi:hypothetical protein